MPSLHAFCGTGDSKAGQQKSVSRQNERGSKGEERTVGALGRGVEEEDGLVDDTADGATGTDKAAHNSSGATGHKGDDSVGGTAAGLHPEIHPFSLCGCTSAAQSGSLFKQSLCR